MMFHCVHAEVEIDESKFGRRKYNRGRWQEGHWVFGGRERVTGNTFLVEVEKRDAATLVPLIQQYIRPCSVIFSNEWRAYSSLQYLGYTHHTVNHSQNFVDPNTGAHTLTVERMWGGVKAMMRKQRSMNSLSCLKPTCRRPCGGRSLTPFCDAFQSIISHITQQYPCT